MTALIHRNSRTASRRVGEEVFVICSDRNTLTILNDTAGRLWELLETDSTADALARALCQEFEVGESEARRDVETFVEDMIGRKLVERTEE